MVRSNINAANITSVPSPAPIKPVVANPLPIVFIFVSFVI